MDGENSREFDGKIDLQVLLTDMLRGATHFFWLEIILVCLCIGALSFISYQAYRPQYRAEASFTVHVINPLYSSIQVYNSATAQQMAKTFPYILTSSALSDLVREELGITAIPGITANTVENTNIFTLSVTASEPQLAYDVLQAVMVYYPQVAEFVVGPTKMSLIDESGVPTEPANPLNYQSSALRGALFGTCIWLGFLVLNSFVRSTVRNEEQLKKMTNLPCLGLLPRAKGYGKGKRRLRYPVMMHDDELLGFSEAIRQLRIRVEKELKNRGKKVLLVSSAIPGEGKTTVAVNLAIALARSGKKTLLLDCDLRNPSVGKAFGVTGAIGLAEFLKGEAATDEIFRRPIADLELFAVYGGKSTEESVELIRKQETKKFMDTSRELFDYVIIDTPPCSMMVDAMEIAAWADCALLTIRQDFAPQDRILDGAQNLTESGVDVIGCTLNGVEKMIVGPSYGYRTYGYYYRGSYQGYGSATRKGN